MKHGIVMLVSGLIFAGCVAATKENVPMNYYGYAGCTVDEKKEGIHLLVCNTQDGSFQRVGVLSNVVGTTYFVLDRSCKHLYTFQEDPQLAKPLNAVAVCYAIGPTALREINRIPLHAGVPCHISLDQKEEAIVWADYGNAIAGVCALKADGSLDTAVPTVTIQHTGSGPDKPRQDKAHAHCAWVTPDNRYLGIVDLGLDQVKFYDFATWKSGLKEVPSLTIKTAPGAGPRHILFHQNKQLMFLLNELNNTISTYRYTGHSFEHICTLPTLPADFKAFSKTAAVKLTADGKMVFASNRGHDSIAAYDVDAQTGMLTLRAISPLAGKFPRDFELMPGEKFVLVGHEMSNEIQTYALDRAKGTLTPVGAPFNVHKPLCFKFGTPAH